LRKIILLGALLAGCGGVDGEEPPPLQVGTYHGRVWLDLHSSHGGNPPIVDMPLTYELFIVDGNVWRIHDVAGRCSSDVSGGNPFFASANDGCYDFDTSIVYKARGYGDFDGSKLYIEYTNGDWWFGTDDSGSLKGFFEGELE